MSSAAAPPISILLPAYDAADTLPACLRSVARQTERRWECVVADDGSRDATLAVAGGAAPPPPPPPRPPNP
ncbi:MAG: glycosyltransferase, partial [Thermodesulfobacteriota bacterium]